MEKLSLYTVGFDYAPGQANGIADYLYQNTHLLKDEFDIHFVDFYAKDERDYFLEMRNGVPVHHFQPASLKDFRLPAAFVKWLEGVPKNSLFDLHGVFRPLNYAVSRVLRKKQLRYMFTPHDDYSDFGMRNRRYLKLAYVWLFDKKNLDDAALVHTISAPGRTTVARYTAPSRIRLVTNLVQDLNPIFDPSALEKQVCFIGRFDIFQKGIDWQLEAFGQFKHRDGQGVRFVMIGPSSPEELAQVRDLCRNQYLVEGTDVLITGKLPESDLNQRLLQSYVYLQLSRFEGFGLSIAQALSFYKPVIITDQVPIYDKVLKYNAGFVARNAEEASRQLSRVFSMSAAEYETMARNARRCYEKEFHPDVIKPQLIDLYKEAFSMIND